MPNDLNLTIYRCRSVSGNRQNLILREYNINLPRTTWLPLIQSNLVTSQQAYTETVAAGGGTSQHSTRDLIEKVYLVDNFSQTIRLDDVFDYAMFIVSLIGRPGILQRCGGGAIK